jgi:macrolide transport system ATP-binding/permease protein
MISLLRDLRFAARMLVKSPAFTLVAVLTLAVGLGATTVVFSWIRGLVLEPLPGVPGQDRLRPVVGRSKGGDWRSISAPDARVLAQSGLPAGVACFDMAPMSLTSGGRPERIWGMVVTGNFFDVLGVPIAAGRSFRPEEDSTAGTHPVAVLSHELWWRRFAGDPAVVGRTILLNRQAFTVIGVAAAPFQGPVAGLRIDLYVPLAMQPLALPGSDLLTDQGHRWLQAIARLHPGVSQESAQAALDTLSARLAATYPDSNDGYRLLLFRFWKSPNGASSFLLPVLSVLGAMALLVLLLACANVANLLLVRALGRRREIAVRLALGAGRALIVRQLLIEGLLLALLAGACGLGIAAWGRHLLLAFIPPTDAPVSPAFPLDAGLLGFAALLALSTGVLFSLAPALQATSPDVASTLRNESGAVSGGRKGLVRSTLVVAQITLSCLLLITAGLFVRSLGRASGLDPGFAARNVLLATVDLFPGGYDEARGRAFYRELQRRIEALPGVESASLASAVPLDFGGSSSQSLEVAGYVPAKDEEVVIEYYAVGSGYLRSLGIPLVDGRDFTAQDDAAGARAVIINQTMAQRYWRGRPALGGTVRIGQQDHTVVGIAGNGSYQNLGETPKAHFYLPVLQRYRPQMTLQVRTAGDPAAFATALRREVRALDPDLPLTAVKTMREHLRISVFSQRLAASFLGSFGALALVLATVGLYSLIRYAVSQRTREMGVRMALGASRHDIERLVVGEGMVLALIGLGLGLALAFGITRFLGKLLLGVSATDPAIFVAITVLLAGVSVLSSYLPARAAAAVSPMMALRAE